MFESLLGKLLIVGVVTAIAMAPKYRDAIDRQIRSIRRIWSQ
jgi:hypothetical protein